MGKSKSFIDKKKSVTYNLVYRSTADADDVPERTLMEAERGADLPSVDEENDDIQPVARKSRYPPGHPLAWLEEEMNAEPISEDRRRELVELGFDDDGYDYSKHLRVLGRGALSFEGVPSSASAADVAGADGASETASGSKPEALILDAPAAGPSVFVKANAAHAPEDDIALFDASALTVMTAADEEKETEGLMGGVTAFSKKKQHARAAEKKEIEELAAMMAALEDDEDVELDEETTLLDDFIVAATTMETAGEGVASQQQEGQEGGSDSYSDIESYEDDDDWSDDEEERNTRGEQRGPSGSRKPPPRAGSIASTYWREERTDRRNLLTVVDERFEHLALEYDEAELDLADIDEELPADARGVADVSEFENLLDEFLEQHGRGEATQENGMPSETSNNIHSTIREELEANGMDDSDAAITIQRAREAIRRAEEAENDTAPLPTELETRMLQAPREKWDIESMASLRSNLFNHPGTITEPPSGKTGPAPAMIRLNKAGIPMGVLPPRHLVNQLQKQQQAAGENGGGHSDDKNEEEDGDSENDGGAVIVIPERRKGETAEEKKARKNAVKLAQKEARAAKKELKMLYKEESVKAQKRAATAHVQPTLVL